MNKKEAVKNILNTLELRDEFQRLDLDRHEIELISPYLEPFLDECQNSSPSLGKLLSIAKDYNYTLECYIVNTDRKDTRFTCEGIVLKNVTRKQLIDLLNNQLTGDEVTLSECGEHNFNIRFWWD